MLKKLGLFCAALGLCLTLGLGTANAYFAEVEPGGIGDLLLWPLYDLRLDQSTPNRTAEWGNWMVIENTTGAWTAFHLRFRSWRKSIEVYDHIVLLSPYDVFWLDLSKAEAGGFTSSGESIAMGDIIMFSGDTHTLRNSGLIYAPDTTWTEKFQDFLLEDCGYTAAMGYDLEVEKEAGHVEAIGLWSLSIPSVLYSALGGGDTHDIEDIVKDLWREEGFAAINVYDIMQALYYQHSALNQAQLYGGWEVAVQEGRCGDLPPYQDRGPVANRNIVIDDDTFRPDDPFSVVDPEPDNETGLDEYRRWGIDCPNALAGGWEFYDTGNGRFESENWIAISDFRTCLYNLSGIYDHRDDYEGGAIVFPVNVLFWNPTDQIWYVNENWATTIGPGLRDGDDFIYPSAPNWFPNTNVDWFNDIWSLDDLEWALYKESIWDYYVSQDFGVAGVVGTDVNITYPTKHYHWFFYDWPYYTGGNVQSYYGAVDDYRGRNWNGIVGTGTNLSYGAEGSQTSIEYWYEYEYNNGLNEAISEIWDMDQNQEFTPPDTRVPPGSPWRPEGPPPENFIPHEVNVLQVGTGNTYHEIQDASGYLATNFGKGQFTFRQMFLRNGQRDDDSASGVVDKTNSDASFRSIYGVDTPYHLPPIGIKIFTHTFGPGTDGITRSAMSEWKYKGWPEFVGPTELIEDYMFWLDLYDGGFSRMF